MIGPPFAQSSDKQSLAGQFLIAMPGMTDPNFARSLVYVCAHSADGAMGLIVNAPSPETTFYALLRQLGIGSGAKPTDVPEIVVHRGGPVDTKRGFVLHSADYSSGESTVAVSDGIRLTITLDILQALASGSGPSQALFALGYAGWMPGQLEAEIMANGWLTASADARMVFDPDSSSKYDRVLAGLGINAANLSTTAGRA